MNNLSLNNEINSLPAVVKSALWQFVRGDMPIRTFELWIYSNDNDVLRQTFGEDSYLELVMLDYKDGREIYDLKIAIYKFLIQFQESCLCYTFPNNTLLYPFTDDAEEIFIKEQIDLLKNTLSIENFSGKPPIHGSRWYHPGALCCCSECKTWWFVIFEETEGADYYLVRLNKEEALLISRFPSWPSESWPPNLKNWDTFIHLKFQSWNNLYIQNKLANATNFLMNYNLNISKKIEINS